MTVADKFVDILHANLPKHRVSMTMFSIRIMSGHILQLLCTTFSTRILGGSDLTGEKRAGSKFSTLTANTSELSHGLGSRSNLNSDVLIKQQAEPTFTLEVYIAFRSIQ